MNVRARSPLPRPRRATAAVEFALVASLLVPLLLGIWEVGRLAQVQQLTNNAVREAGRQASTGTRTVAQAQDAAKNYLARAGINTAGVTVTVVNVTAESRPDPTAANQMDCFRVTVSLPFNNVRWVMLDTLTGLTVLTATADWYSMKDKPLTVSSTIPVE